MRLTPTPTNLHTAIRHLGAAFDQVDRPNPSATRTAPTPGEARLPGRLTLSGERYGAVLTALEAEAYVLRRAQTVVGLADGLLQHCENALRLDASDPDDSSAYGPPVDPQRLVAEATFDGRPLFDGRYALHVGGGRLDLPDLISRPATLDRVVPARRALSAFGENPIAERLEVVEATIRTTTLTRPLIADAAEAQHTADLSRREAAAAAPVAGDLTRRDSLETVRGRLVDLVI